MLYCLQFRNKVITDFGTKNRAYIETPYAQGRFLISRSFLFVSDHPLFLAIALDKNNGEQTKKTQDKKALCELFIQ